MRLLKNFLILAIGWMLLFASCKVGMTTYLYLPVDLQMDSTKTSEIRFLPQDKVPFDHLTTRSIRTRIHFLNSTEGNSHFSGEVAIEFANALIEETNKRLSLNDKMNLPQDNNTPVRDVKIRLSLSQNERDLPGILFHYDDELCYFIKKGTNANRYNEAVIDKYGSKDDSALDLFLMPFKPEDLASEVQALEITGIALGSSIKIAGIYETQKPAWYYSGVLLHELGHVLGLRHTWNMDDGCGDTPRNENCWNQTDEPPCNGAVSNNVMDYNVHQSAFTPCQIDKMHSRLSNPVSKRRKMMVKNWCQKKNGKMVITGERVWTKPRDVVQSIVVSKGGQLQIATWVSMPEDSDIVVEKGARLELTGAKIYNDCGLTWKGIRVKKGGQIVWDQDSVLENTSADNLSSI